MKYASMIDGMVEIEVDGGPALIRWFEERM